MIRFVGHQTVATYRAAELGACIARRRTGGEVVIALGSRYKTACADAVGDEVMRTVYRACCANDKASGFCTCKYVILYHQSLGTGIDVDETAGGFFIDEGVVHNIQLVGCGIAQAFFAVTQHVAVRRVGPLLYHIAHNEGGAAIGQVYVAAVFTEVIRDGVVQYKVGVGAAFELVSLGNGVVGVVVLKNEGIDVVDIDIVLIARVGRTSAVEKFAVFYNGFAVGNVAAEYAHFIAVEFAVAHAQVGAFLAYARPIVIGHSGIGKGDVFDADIGTTDHKNPLAIVDIIGNEAAGLQGRSSAHAVYEEVVFAPLHLFVVGVQGGVYGHGIAVLHQGCYLTA